MFPEPEHHKSPPRDASEQLQQPAIAGAVDARRTCDRDRHPRARRRIASDALAFDFRHLIDIAGPQRRVFVRGRMLDVAVHANRAAVDKPPNAGGGGGVDQIAHGRGVDRAVGRPSKCRPAGRRRRCDRPPRRRARRARATARSSRAPIAGSMPEASRSRACAALAHERPHGYPRRASVRARWPPVKPVAPVTRTRTALLQW